MVRFSEQNSSSAFGFSAAHFFLIAGSLTSLLVLSFMTGHLTLAKLSRLNPLHAQEVTPRGPTYDEVRAQVNAEVSVKPNTDELVKKQNEQLSLIDPNFGSGSVLGASTDTIPSVDQVMTEERLNNITVTRSAKNDRAAMQQYADSLRTIEEYYDPTILLAAITSQDPAALGKAHTWSLRLIAELQALPVPANYETYHKYKLVYYSSLATMAESMTNNDSGNSAATLATSMFLQLNDQLEVMRAQLSQQYGVQL